MFDLVYSVFMYYSSSKKEMVATNVKPSTIEKIQCLCLQIGLTEAIYLRPSNSNKDN